MKWAKMALALPTGLWEYDWMTLVYKLKYDNDAGADIVDEY